jgi:hypothetical protein
MECRVKPVKPGNDDLDLGRVVLMLAGTSESERSIMKSRRPSSKPVLDACSKPRLTMGMPWVEWRFTCGEAAPACGLARRYYAQLLTFRRRPCDRRRT